MRNVAVIGSCLSNIPSTFLVNDYRWDRLNNVSVTRSDHFVDTFFDNRNVMPPLEGLLSFLGLDANSDREALMQINDQYKDHCGLRHVATKTVPLFANLEAVQFDVLLLDNLHDTTQAKNRYEGGSFPSFSMNFGLHMAPRFEEIQHEFRGVPPLSATESAGNWRRIIEYLCRVQPNARIFFSCAQYVTREKGSPAYRRAVEFSEIFQEIAKDLPIEIAPPINAPLYLTKLPDDGNHLDMSVYRAMAGGIYLSVETGWRGWAPASSAAVPLAALAPTQEATQPDAPALKEVVARALEIEVARVGEDAAMTATENWDSLAQLRVLMDVEQAFGVKMAFEEITDADSIAKIRSALADRGVIAADDPIFVENIFARLVRRSLNAPDDRFVTLATNGGDRPISNRELLTSACAIGRALETLPGAALVAIVLDHSAHLYAPFVGAVLAGKTPTFLSPLTAKQDPAIFKEGMRILFERIQPSAIITSRAVESILPQSAARRIYVEDLEPTAWDDVVSEAVAWLRPKRRGDLAFLQHSSGTTGHKKGVMLTHAQVQDQAARYAAAIGMRPKDTIVSWLPLYHDMGLLTSFVIPAIVGAPIVSLDALEWVVAPTTLLDAIERHQAAYCWLPNFAFHHLMQAARGTRTWNLHSVRALVNCSEPCRADTFSAFAEKFGPMGVGGSKLQVSYAMAENVFAITQTKIGAVVRKGVDPGAKGYLSCGSPLPGVEIEIRDEAGVALGEGQIGEICVQSTCLFDGYYRLPALTAERVQGGWYRTRDIGCLVDGELFVIGRTDDLLIVNGRNIVAHEVEDALNSVSGIVPGRVLLTSVFEPVLGASKLIVLAERHEDASRDAPIEAVVRERVFSLCAVTPSKVAMLPRGFLIKSTSGKLARAQSLAKYEAQGG